MPNPPTGHEAHINARYTLTPAGWAATEPAATNRRPCPQCTHWASNHTGDGCLACEAQGRRRICGWSRDAIEAGER